MVQQIDPAAEVAEAEALGLPPEQIVALGRPQTLDGMGLTYEVPDADKESWRPAWRMEKGWDGEEYGKPMKLPKNPNALAIYLAKRRVDGGRLFTLNMPSKILGPGQFQCFAAPEFCAKKLDTKGKLIDHMESKHPAESRHYAGHIQQIRESIQADNPVLAKMVAQIAATPDRGNAIETPEDMRAKHDADVPVIAPLAEPETFSVRTSTFDCAFPGCDWKPKAGGQKPAFALTLHMNKHKDVSE